jgi:hypothetical protein
MENSLEKCLHKELADMYIRLVIAEHSLELERQAKLKLQEELDKLKHDQSLQAMQNYHERRQAALDFFRKKYEIEHGIKPDECDCGRQDCTNLGEDEID